MKRLLFSWLLLGLIVSPLAAEDKPQGDEAPARAAVEKLKENPNDVLALNQLASQNMVAIYKAIEADPKAAAAKLAEATKLIDSLEPTSDEAKTLLRRLKSQLGFLQTQLETAQSSLDDLEKKVAADPNDSENFAKYTRKLMSGITPLVRTEPAKAEKLVNEAKAKLAKVAEAAKDEGVKKQAAAALRSLGSLEGSIESAKKLAELIGKDAAPLQVETWVNGSPLTDADLKGKVVLLDFWAVWCGPCVATFPHLKEWNEKYADKGLVMIGLTRYYNYQWDEDAGRATRSTGEVTPAAEQEMLAKFTEHHGLHHRIGIQSKDSTASKFYGVTGIPQVVVIDREGKVRLIRVGSGDKNATDIGEMLEKLIADKPAATSGE
jgi:thiol-disulfide isomerase/thioredoxin